MSDFEYETTGHTKIAALLDRAEGLYLRLLRALILIIASFLLAYATWLVATGLFKIMQSPDNVTQDETYISADELVASEPTKSASALPTTKDRETGSPSVHAYYRSFVQRYHQLYRAKFEPYRHQEDKQLTQAEFDGAFLDTSARAQAVARGDLSFDDDRRKLELLLATMTTAAQKETTVAQLDKYHKAKKIAVSRKVERLRTETVQGWDSSSMDCPGWYNSPIGCPAVRTSQVPYFETITKMEYPEGIRSHSDVFREFQERFFDLFDQRQRENREEAQAKRQSIVEGIQNGYESLTSVVKILAIFMVLMFLFLLIAIERHQRKLAADRVLEAQIQAD